MTSLVRWEGEFFANHSFATINRALCRELHLAGFALDCAPVGAPEIEPALTLEGPTLAPLVDRRAADVPAVVVRHRVPPDFSRPAGSRLVIMQSWEFGPAPVDWVRAIRDNADELWVLSEFVRRGFIQAGMDAERVRTLPAGFDPAVFHPEADPLPVPTTKRFRFLYVGGSVYRKGLDVLLAAYAAEFTRSDDVCLVIKDHAYYGHRIDGALARLRANPQAPDVLYYFDHALPQQMAGFYRAASCLVHPFRGEGFGMPVLEAMACGRPVIVTDAGPVREFCPPEAATFIPAREVRFPEPRIDHLDTGGLPILAEPEPVALRRAMREAYEDPGALDRRGRQGTLHAHAHFTWSRVAARYGERLRELMSAATAPPVAESVRRELTAYTAVLERTPGDVAALIGAARCAVALDETPTARALLAHALAIEPTHPGAHAALAALGR